MAGISRQDYVFLARRFQIIRIGIAPFLKLSYRILLPPAHCKFERFILEYATPTLENLVEQRGSIVASSGMLVS